MKVVLYHPWIYLKSGLERTILELARRSRHQWKIYTSHYDMGGTYPELKEYDIREAGRVSVKRNYGAVLGASARIASTRLDLSDADAMVVCCDGVGSFITLRNRQVPILNLCFTPLRAVYDMEYRRRHLARRGVSRWAALLAEAAYRRVDRHLWRNYDKVVCISETVRERVQEAGLKRDGHMPVYYPGVDESAIAPSQRFEPFFFLPGRIMWTKNIELGIQAFRRFKAACDRDYRLVVAGMVDEKSRPYFEKLQVLAGDDPDIQFHIEPTDQEMQEYYSGCSGVIFTAFNEDLGLTPMEGMAKGKPVIAVNRGGPREVVRDHATGYLADPSPESFSLAMELLTDRPERPQVMGRAGLERVMQFTWKQFVDDMDAELEAMVTATSGGDVSA